MTKDGVEYVKGMTLYKPSYDRGDRQFVLYTLEETWMDPISGRIWFPSKSGNPGSMGHVYDLYGRRESAIECIIAALKEERAMIDETISKWETV